MSKRSRETYDRRLWPRAGLERLIVLVVDVGELLRFARLVPGNTEVGKLRRNLYTGWTGFRWPAAGVLLLPLQHLARNYSLASNRPSLRWEKAGRRARVAT